MKIKEIYRVVKVIAKSPLSEDKIAEIVESQFEYIVKEMKSDTWEDLMLPFLGKFKVSKRKKNELIQINESREDTSQE